MTATTKIDNQVPDELRDAYDTVANHPDVRAAVAAYHMHDPHPTPDGAFQVAHGMRLTIAEQRREGMEKYRAQVEAAARLRICPGCGGPNTGRTAWTELCRACQLVAKAIQTADARAERVPAGGTREESVTRYLADHPKVTLR
jgi:hypothetical protein